MELNRWMSVLLFLVAIYGSYILALTYRKRRMPIARTMFLTMLGSAFYSVGYGFELLSCTLPGIKLSLQIEYLGIPFVSALWLYLVIQFTGTAPGYRKRLAVLLFIMPFTIYFLHLTNDWHHLIYADYVPNAGSLGPVYLTVKGPWYWVHIFYSYVVLLGGFLLFIPMYFRSAPVVRKQILILLFGAAVPMLSNVAYLFGSNLDLTPFGFTVSGITYIWGIFRFNLLRLTPIALAKAFETIRDGVVILDEEDRVVKFNPAAHQVFPEWRKRRSPVPASEAFKDDERLLERIFSAARDDHFTYRRMANDRTLFYHCRLYVLYDNTEALIGKILLFSDVTGRMEDEARLRENARQLSELNAFKDKLFTVVAHDIRDPIAVLVSMTDLLRHQTNLSQRELSEWMKEMHGQVRSTLSLVDNLLDWYRSQKGQVSYQPQECRLRQAVSHSIDLVGAKAAMRGIVLSEYVEEELMVYADREMLDLTLRNLIANAIKYASVGGFVEVSATAASSEVVVSVRDDGAGIDPETAECLRQEGAFFRKAASGERAGEARFGLALTREFVRINGGRLWFETVPGEGTTFFFTVPCSRKPAGSRVDAT
ncbi:histidine kinase N-terminal 7TM domain-containing protein [Cohnella thailandensis]|uniref:histidine kinase n=1 Tax=Cohnella thailandensis TaxID=557557 RepID=A0A841T7E1_9BACL|nr:histidine kinase N-terminal 7TM domain-containing protein [Cohnella thailandensis]MBB6637767.1 PAS domain-containing protein [Cohnella thailandensis]MBP1974056.1 signal transduction histidine kinase [Cohnella thailandensis]